jgi:catechol 2,3-dioxygenase-like lactoylglutathione lyase family enzyme
MATLDHIAIHVTNIQRSREFYRDILHMEVTEPVSLRDQSAGLRYGHSLFAHGPAVVRNLIQKAKPSAIQHMFTDICHCTSPDGSVHLVLVQQTHPEKGYVKSVTGNTIYGFSCHLSADVDTDDLGWDLGIADISFEHGDTGTDGTFYTPNGRKHSLYIRDPDGRMIELIPSSKGGTGSFLTGLGYAVLYVDNIQASSAFYKKALGLGDITPQDIPRDPWKKTIVWLGTPDETPVILLYHVTHPDGTPSRSGGFGLDHIGIITDPPASGGIPDPCCVLMHEDRECESFFIQDPDGYITECMKP